ncbi:MAG: glycosyltransferase [Nanoarchaeota archaeon]
MKVLFNCNNSAFQAPGGGEILLLKTREYLLKQKIKVKLFNQWEDKLTDHNILHNFGLSSNCYDLINTAYNKKVPVAITPIYSWPSMKFAFRSGLNLKNKLNLSLYAFLHNYKPINELTYANKMLKKANLILTDSKAEKDVLMKTFKLDKNKFKVAPYGVDKRFYNSNKKEFINKYDLEDFLLYTGRIEPRKNVLTLIKIANKFNLPLVIIGSGDYQSGNEYYNLCKKAAKKNIVFINKIEHESSLLSSAYAAAKAVVLPSWLENPGLSVLEGGLAGSNVLVTSRGSTTEYFSNYAFYVNPFDNKDIGKKLLMVYKKEKDNKLREHIKKNFIWEVATSRVAKYYKDLL